MSDMVDTQRDAQIEQQGGPGRSEWMLDPWLKLDSVISQALSLNLHWSYDDLPSVRLRQRKLKAQDRANVQQILQSVFANLAYVAIVRKADPVVLGVSLRASKRKKSRYDRDGFAALPTVLERVSEYDQGRSIFRLTKSRTKGIASQIEAGSWFVQTIRRMQPDSSKFQFERGAELIWLTRTKRDYVDGTRTAEPVEYVDTPETILFRGQVKSLNNFLAVAPLTFEDDGGPPVLTAWRDLTRQFKVEDGKEPAFNLCGRLFGGWWQSLPRTRRAAIRIGGERVADLDFSNMFLRLAYLELGVTPPDGDLYAGIPGFDAPQWREGVKRVVNALLFRHAPLVRLPKLDADALPPRTSGAAIRNAILAAHPKLAGMFEQGNGLRLMFLESQVLMSALLRLVDAGVPALGMHDGMMVARSKVEVAAEAMQAAAIEVVGFPLPISLKAEF